jgi:uncharacterized MnhB-related membrane protein
MADHALQLALVIVIMANALMFIALLLIKNREPSHYWIMASNVVAIVAISYSMYISTPEVAIFHL